MKQQLVFMHQNYPAQFGPITRFLLEECGTDVAFFSQYAARPPIDGLKHFFYQPVKTGHEDNPYFFTRYFEMECAAMQGVHAAMLKSGVQPDCLIGHVAFGNMGLLHVEFPDVPKIGFFELFYDPFGRFSETRPEYPAPKPNRLRVPLRNATQLMELEYCTRGYSPTPFQKSTYPEAYQHKLSVLFDGIDTKQYQPGAPSGADGLTRTWPPGAKLVTYVSRGLEAMRGFDIFMEVAHRVCQRRADVHFIIAGNPKTHYGSEMLRIQEPTFKEFVLKQRPFDLSRFHFLDWIPEAALVDLFRLSDCHFYWTVPFTLSWSLFQAMSTGCLILGSDTGPVRDIVTDGVNGLLAPPYDVEAIAGRMLDMLDAPERYRPLREAARESMVASYGFDVCLPRLAEFFLQRTGTPDAPKIPMLSNPAEAERR